MREAFVSKILKQSHIPNPTYKNDAENKFSQSILNYINYNDEFDDLYLSEVRDKFPGNEFFIEYINRTIIYTPVMLLVYTWRKKNEDKRRNNFFYTYILEVVYKSSSLFRRYYNQIYDQIVSINQIERLYTQENLEHFVMNKFRDENNKDVHNYYHLKTKVLNTISKSLLDYEDIEFLEDMNCKNNLNKAAMLFEEFKHSMQFIELEFKKFYKKNHTNIELIFEVQTHFDSVKLYYNTHFNGDPMFKSDKYCPLVCKLASRNPKTLSRAISYFVGFMKTHDKYFDRCSITNNFLTEMKDYPEILLNGTFIYKGMSAKFIISFTLKDMITLRECILRNQVYYKYLTKYYDLITNNKHRMEIRECSYAIYQGFQPIFSSNGKYMALSYCTDRMHFSTYDTKIYCTHALQKHLYLFRKCLVRSMMDDMVHLTFYSANNTITDDYIMDIRTGVKTTTLPDMILYKMRDNLLYYTNNAYDIRKAGLKVAIYTMGNELMESHKINLLNHNVGDFFREIYILVPYYHPGDRKIRIYNASTQTLLKQCIKTKSQIDLKSKNTVVLFGKGTKLLVLQSNEQEHDFISVFDLLGCVEVDRISIKKYSGFGYAKNWLFYIPFRKKEVGNASNPFNQDAKPTQFSDRLIIMELVDHNKTQKAKFKYDDYLEETSLAFDDAAVKSLPDIKCMKYEQLKEFENDSDEMEIASDDEDSLMKRKQKKDNADLKNYKI